eukprot:PhM_4_TR17459/c0_g1_i1/m.36757
MAACLCHNRLNVVVGNHCKELQRRSLVPRNGLEVLECHNVQQNNADDACDEKHCEDSEEALRGNVVLVLVLVHSFVRCGEEVVGNVSHKARGVLHLHDIRNICCLEPNGVADAHRGLRDEVAVLPHTGDGHLAQIVACVLDVLDLGLREVLPLRDVVRAIRPSRERAVAFRKDRRESSHRLSILFSGDSVEHKDTLGNGRHLLGRCAHETDAVERVDELGHGVALHDAHDHRGHNDAEEQRHADTTAARDVRDAARERSGRIERIERLLCELEQTLVAVLATDLSGLLCLRTAHHHCLLVGFDVSNLLLARLMGVAVEHDLAQELTVALHEPGVVEVVNERLLKVRHRTVAAETDGRCHRCKVHCVHVRLRQVLPEGRDVTERLQEVLLREQRNLFVRLVTDAEVLADAETVAEDGVACVDQRIEPVGLVAQCEGTEAELFRSRGGGGVEVHKQRKSVVHLGVCSELDRSLCKDAASVLYHRGGELAVQDLLVPHEVTRGELNVAGGVDVVDVRLQDTGGRYLAELLLDALLLVLVHLPQHLQGVLEVVLHLVLRGEELGVARQSAGHNGQVVHFLSRAKH